MEALPDYQYPPPPDASGEKELRAQEVYIDARASGLGRFGALRTENLRSGCGGLCARYIVCQPSDRKIQRSIYMASLATRVRCK